MRKHSGTNVDTRDINHIGTGDVMLRMFFLAFSLLKIIKVTYTSFLSDPIHSPLFDGSATSMGGNGAFQAYPGTPLPGAPPGLNDIIPSAEGGGCVTTGPFKE